jgi:excisionase family DNA binding protein
MASSEEMAVNVLKVADLAGYLRVHQSTIYRLVKRGELPGFRIGSDWRFNREAIDRWRLEQMAKVESTN